MKLFNELSASILHSLFEEFPVDKEYRIDDYPEFDNMDLNRVFYGTFDFLRHENYIRIEQDFIGGYAGVTLTEKGLSVLNSIPKSLNQNEPLSTSLKNALKNGGEEIISDTMKNIFAFGTNLLIGATT